MKIQNVSFEVEGEKLIGNLYIPDKAADKLPAVVIFHGRGSSKKRHADRAQALAEAGFFTLNFDFRGCGESDGDFAEQTITKGYHDALAGYDFLVSNPLVDRSRVGVWGGSFGGYLAALVSAARPVKSLMLAAPAMYKDEWWEHVIENWEHVIEKIDEGVKNIFKNQGEMILSRTKSLSAIQDYAGSILIEEHESDEVIPRRIPRAYFDAATKSALREYAVIPEAPHALHDQKFRKHSIKLTVDWFRKTL